MDSDAPAGPVKTLQTSGSSVEAVRDAPDEVLVLSPGVTLTLGRDALLLSGRSPLVAAE